MSPEKDRELRQRFPLVFQGPLINDEPIRCRDGWYDLLFMLFGALEARIAEVPYAERSNYRMAQVKEKFGRLRVYTHTHQTLDMLAVIGLAERLSETTCDVCGAEGRIRNLSKDHPIVAARCDEHAAAP